MSLYTPRPQVHPTGLDELGLRLGLRRLPGENLPAFRDRLLWRAKFPPGALFQGLGRTISSQVGLLDVPLWRIDVNRDEDEAPVVPDPRVQANGLRLRVWEDYENNVLSLDLDLESRSGAYFVSQVREALEEIDFLSLTVLSNEEDGRLSRHLMVDTQQVNWTQVQLQPSQLNHLDHGLIAEIGFSRSDIFREEQGSPDAMTEPGHYFVDRTRGLIYSYELARGECAYRMRMFSFVMFWTQIPVLEFKDPDMGLLLKQSLIEDDKGEGSLSVMGPDGARLTNTLLRVHPLEWGT